MYFGTYSREYTNYVNLSSKLRQSGSSQTRSSFIPVINTFVKNHLPLSIFRIINFRNKIWKKLICSANGREKWSLSFSRTSRGRGLYEASPPDWSAVFSRNPFSLVINSRIARYVFKTFLKRFFETFGNKVCTLRKVVRNVPGTALCPFFCMLSNWSRVVSGRCRQ